MSVTASRRQRILDLVLAGETDAKALGIALDVSLSTVRRDLALLSDEGALLRTYGGAAIRPEQSLQERSTTNLPQKQAIALCAAPLVKPGEQIILDGGTTTGALATLLAMRGGVRVITNGLPVIQALAGSSGVELVALGGVLRPLSLSFVGPHAERTLRRMSAAKVFLGADGVVAGRGICEATDAQASLKEIMIEQADEIYVLADASKLGRAASSAWTPLGRPWTLITDAGASDEQLDPFRRLAAVTVRIAAHSVSVTAPVSVRPPPNAL